MNSNDVPETLYQHAPHPHTPQHPLEVYSAQRRAHAAKSHTHAANEHLAVWITDHTGTMTCAYIFLGIGLGSLVGYLTGNVILASVFGAVSSYVLQLVLLPIIQLGTQIQGRKQEVAIDQAHHNTVKLVHDMVEMVRHLNAQDAELVKQTGLLLSLAHGTAHSGAEPGRPARDHKTGRYVSTRAAKAQA